MSWPRPIRRIPASGPATWPRHSSSSTTLYKDYRTQMAGLTAQMWQAKCYEEQGKIGEAIGIYKLLLEQPDPRLRPLQRFVGYFYIVALAKRKEYALAADEANHWLEKYKRREERRSQEGLGVLLELAKNHRRPDEPGHQQDRASAGDKTDRRRSLAGRSIHLALQERRPCPAQEIQADRGRAGPRNSPG